MSPNSQPCRPNCSVLCGRIAVYSQPTATGKQPVGGAGVVFAIDDLHTLMTIKGGIGLDGVHEVQGRPIVTFPSVGAGLECACVARAAHPWGDPIEVRRASFHNHSQFDQILVQEGVHLARNIPPPCLSGPSAQLAASGVGTYCARSWPSM